MACRVLVALCLVPCLFVGSVLPTARGWAETMVQQNVDTRVVLAFRVNPAALQKWLPTPWQIAPIAAGPSKDANLTISFIDRLVNHDREGKLIATGTTRLAALVVPAKQAESGGTALMDIREFYVSAEVPGPYKTGLPVTIRREASAQAMDREPGTAIERWELQDSSGGVIECRIEYQRGVPSRARAEVRLHSAADPSFFRIYRPDIGTDVVKSVPAGIDRLRSYQFRVTMSELQPLFDGTEQLVSVAVLPWYVREVFLP